MATKKLSYYKKQKLVKGLEDAKLLRNLKEEEIEWFKKLAYSNMLYPYEKVKVDLGRKIFIAREVIGFSRDKFEKISSFSRNQLTKIERGKANINLESLYKISYYLKVSPRIFFTDWEELELYHDYFKPNNYFTTFSIDHEFQNLAFQMESADENDIKHILNICKKKKYFDMLYEDLEFEKYEWTGKIGAALAIQESYLRTHFYVGAMLSIHLYKSLYEKQD
jgi:transcriptional regulator with XRE-family HTH domain